MVFETRANCWSMMTLLSGRVTTPRTLRPPMTATVREFGEYRCAKSCNGSSTSHLQLDPLTPRVGGSPNWPHVGRAPARAGAGPHPLMSLDDRAHSSAPARLRSRATRFRRETLLGPDDSLPARGRARNA